jgi:hypothetical protein
MMRVRSTTAFLVITLAASTGCASSPATNRPRPSKIHKTTEADREDQTKAAISAYVNCAYTSAQTLVNSQGTPMEIAEAAIGDCGREFLALRTTTQNYFAATASRAGFWRAIDSANTNADTVRDDVRREIISRVLRARGPIVK